MTFFSVLEKRTDTESKAVVLFYKFGWCSFKTAVNHSWSVFSLQFNLPPSKSPVISSFLGEIFDCTSMLSVKKSRANKKKFPNRKSVLYRHRFPGMFLKDPYPFSTSVSPPIMCFLFVERFRRSVIIIYSAYPTQITRRNRVPAKGYPPRLSRDHVRARCVHNITRFTRKDYTPNVCFNMIFTLHGVHKTEDVLIDHVGTMRESPVTS